MTAQQQNSEATSGHQDILENSVWSIFWVLRSSYEEKRRSQSLAGTSFPLDTYIQEKTEEAKKI